VIKKRKKISGKEFLVKRLPVEKITLILHKSNVRFIKKTAEEIGMSRNFIINIAVLNLRKWAEEQGYSSEELFRLMREKYDRYLEEEESKN